MKILRLNFQFTFKLRFKILYGVLKNQQFNTIQKQML